MADSATSAIPEGFLESPTNNIVVSRINFAEAKLDDYEHLYAVVLDGVLDKAECDQLLESALTVGGGQWERAQVNVGYGKQRMIEDVRKCGRIIWDSHEMTKRIWRRIERVPEVEEILRLENRPRIVGNGPSKRKEVWTFQRLNERMRFLKYEGGEYFRPHVDGSYETPDGSERSYFTLHLYLNDTGAADGGATLFHAMSMDSAMDVSVAPKQGRILLFQHRGLLHSGDDVVSGVKYTMRTDLMYAIEKPTENKEAETSM